jgi:hypothetical protein
VIWLAVGGIWLAGLIWLAIEIRRAPMEPDDERWG